MNWDALGAIAELIGAIGVVASLAYLGVQIRQSTAQSRLNTNAIEATAFQQLLDHNSKFNMTAVGDPSILRVMESSDEASVEPVDETRFIIWATALHRNYYNAWCLFEKGLISEDQWRIFEATIIRNHRSFASFRRVWQLRRSEFPESFNAAMEERFSA